MTKRPGQARTLALLLLVTGALRAAPATYRTVDDLWRGYDPRALELDPQVAGEELAGDQVLRKIYYTATVDHGFKVRVFAWYGFPRGAQKLPAILHIHGGGQSASPEYVRYWAKRGYAAMSINWGGIPQPEGKETTDWGPIKAYQLDRTNLYRAMPETRANNWYWWTIACRRAITFLERQPEVDPSAIGVFGVSMGGRLTWLVAGIDSRIKAAASVYGAVSMQQEIAGHPGSEQVHFDSPEEAAVWRASLDAIAYAPRIRCPFLFLSGADDFYGAMDFVDDAIGLIPHRRKWQVFSPHFNHHVTAGDAEALPRFMAWQLKHGDPLPETPELRIELKAADHGVRGTVPDPSASFASVSILHSTDPYPQSRFWRTAEVTHGSGWSAPLPVPAGNEPLRVFARVTYRDGLVLSTRLATVSRGQLRDSGVIAETGRSAVIEDFSHGAHDWFVPQAGPTLLLSRVEPFRAASDEDGNPAVTFAPEVNWTMATRKVGDPRWAAPVGAALRLAVKAEQDNEFLVVATQNEYRRDRKTKVFLAPVKVRGGAWQTATVDLSAFHIAQGAETMDSWADVNLLWMAPQYVIRDVSKYPFTTERLGKAWQGQPPIFGKMEWVSSP